MTAEEFLIDRFKKIYQNRPDALKARLSERAYIELNVKGRIDGKEESYAEMMIEFAQYHVQKALEAASEKARIISVLTWSDEYKDVIDEESILNAYPLSNIK